MKGKITIQSQHICLLLLLLVDHGVDSFGLAILPPALFALRTDSSLMLRKSRRTVVRLNAYNDPSASMSSLSLKNIAIPLMNSGKALARSGELLIDFVAQSTYFENTGNLASAGAQLRNSGDCIAQAAASCRFKTGVELVTDELREAATCLAACASKLQAAVEDGVTNSENGRATVVVAAIGTCHIVKQCWLEAFLITLAHSRFATLFSGGCRLPFYTLRK
jgi:hypothetical protein